MSRTLIGTGEKRAGLASKTEGSNNVNCKCSRTGHEKDRTSGLKRALCRYLCPTLMPERQRVPQAAPTYFVEAGARLAEGRKGGWGQAKDSLKGRPQRQKSILQSQGKSKRNRGRGRALQAKRTGPGN